MLCRAVSTRGRPQHCPLPHPRTRPMSPPVLWLLRNHSAVAPALPARPQAAHTACRTTSGRLPGNDPLQSSSDAMRRPPVGGSRHQTSQCAGCMAVRGNVVVSEVLQALPHPGVQSASIFSPPACSQPPPPVMTKIELDPASTSWKCFAGNVSQEMYVHFFSGM